MEECDNELSQAAFDYISQNVENNDEIVNSQPKLRKTQHIRKLNLKYFNSDYVRWDNLRTKFVMGDDVYLIAIC